MSPLKIALLKATLERLKPSVMVRNSTLIFVLHLTRHSSVFLCLKFLSHGKSSRCIIIKPTSR
jgi:hypothetical protein